MSQEEVPNSVVMLRVGNQSVPYKYVKTCHTCMSPHRAYIEQQVILGHSMRSLEREILDYDHGSVEPPDRRSISHHMKNHVPLTHARTMAVYEQRAEEISSTLEEATNSLVDHVTAARLIVQRGTERMLNNEIQPDVKDVLAAASALAKIEADHGGDGGLDFQVFRTAFQTLLEITEQYLPINAREGWREAIKKDPVLNQLREQIAAQAARAAIEGEMVTS
jgi:hypothetical protein